MFSSKIDYTKTAIAATNARKVANKDEYPKKPGVNDAIFDESIGKVRVWDGKKWSTLKTSSGA